jgi:hypothetical protein
MHAAELHGVVGAEEARVGIFDPEHFAYPCYARVAAQRRDNLRCLIEDLEQQLHQALADHHDAVAELTKIEAFAECKRESPRLQPAAPFDPELVARANFGPIVLKSNHMQGASWPTSASSGG